MDSPPISLRPVVDADVAVFFEHQLAPEAQRMVGFSSRDPHDRAAFEEHWDRIRGLDAVIVRTIDADGAVAGYLGHFYREDVPEVCYWLGQEFWGRGIATQALARFLSLVTVRPLFAGVAYDNIGSLRVLEKCGFVIERSKRAFAAGRGEEIDEIVLRLE